MSPDRQEREDLNLIKHVNVFDWHDVLIIINTVGIACILIVLFVFMILNSIGQRS